MFCDVVVLVVTLVMMLLLPVHFRDGFPCLLQDRFARFYSISSISEAELVRCDFHLARFVCIIHIKYILRTS